LIRWWPDLNGLRYSISGLHLCKCDRGLKNILEIVHGFFKIMIGTVMEIKIKKIRTEILTGNASGVINTYKIIQNGKEFFLSRTSRAHGNSIGIVGQKGILYVDSEDNRVQGR
jgi:hypothetical protein